MNALPLRRLFLIGVAVLLGGALGSGTQAVLSANQLLPNLVALPAHEIRIGNSDGVKELRFSTTSANLGDGPFVIIGGNVTGDSQQIDQRIYNSDGSFEDQQAGFWEYHPQHNHIHVDDYADYVLEAVDAPGQSLRTGAKQTFCILDTDRVDHRLPGAPKKAVYTTCGDDLQGMSVGWGDTYRYYLAGQSIDITGLPDGDYRLVIRIDPKGRFAELNESDNESVVNIRIDGNNVTNLDEQNEKPGNGRGRPW